MIVVGNQASSFISFLGPLGVGFSVVELKLMELLTAWGSILHWSSSNNCMQAWEWCGATAGNSVHEDKGSSSDGEGSKCCTNCVGRICYCESEGGEYGVETEAESLSEVVASTDWRNCSNGGCSNGGCWSHSNGEINTVNEGNASSDLNGSTIGTEACSLGRHWGQHWPSATCACCGCKGSDGNWESSCRRQVQHCWQVSTEE